MASMTIVTLRAAWAVAWRKRRARKMFGMLKSKTSATIAGATAVGGGGTLAAFTVLRSYWPGMPGDATTDKALAVVLSAFIVPAIGRVVAWLRGKV